MAFLNKVKEVGFCIVGMFLLTGLFILCGVIPFDSTLFWKFCVGAAMIVVGESLFLVGADIGLVEMGKKAGKNMVKLNKMWLILLFGFLFSFCCTVAEPDINLYVGQIVGLNPQISKVLLLVTFGLGVGIFVLLGLFRLIKNIPLKYIYAGSYLIAIILMFFVSDAFVGIAFDGAGVTTGPITAPFLLAMVIGLSSMRTGKSSQNDSFGIVGLGSIGAIICLLIFGLFVPGGNFASQTVVAQTNFGVELLDNLINTTIVLVPIIAFFMIAQFTFIKLPKRALLKIFIGVLLSFVGLIVFLTGITYGFSPMGYYIGESLATFMIAKNALWVVLIFAVLIGFLVVFTEPSILVFGTQVENVTRGNLKKIIVILSMGIGVAISMLVAILKITYQIQLWWILLPVVVLSVVLAFFLPQMLTGISFDIGGIASGTVVPAFLLPIGIGFAGIVGSSADGFGIVALMSTIPVLVFELLSFIYLKAQKKSMAVDFKRTRSINKFIQKSLRLNSTPKNARRSAKVFVKNSTLKAKSSAKVFMKEKKNG